jgi:16S rRNA (guanine527-N7)-methyltransferase
MRGVPAAPFHVKRKRPIGERRATSPANPEDVAREARGRVARWLDETTLGPRGGFLERIEKMAATLALWGARTNLTADASDPSEIAFHVIDSLAPISFAESANREALEAALARDARALDLGSGAGFPGLVLAAAFEAQFTLAESRRKRASYLQVAAHEMDLKNVAIEQRHASAGNVATGFDLVTARALGASVDLYEIAGAALRPGGLLLLYASADQAPDAISAKGRAAVSIDDSLARPPRFAPPAAWTYRLNHGARVATRTAVLWRKPQDVSDGSLKRR